MKRKFSPTALSTFLESPKAYYWRYIRKLVSVNTSIGTFDHDKICGTLWAEFVDRFYKNVPEEENRKKMLAEWDEKTYGWVPEKIKAKYDTALNAWSNTYHQMFAPDDGVRNGSEKYLENDRFLGYLDGLSHDGVVHEVKTTSRSPAISEQLWKVGNSIQVKLYCVLAKAKGYRIEFAWKDTPNGIFRGPEVDVTAAQLKQWESELNTLADYINSLGEDPAKYPCHPDGCCLLTKGYVSMCTYQTLCDMGETEITKIAYKKKESREEQALKQPPA